MSQDKQISRRKLLQSALVVAPDDEARRSPAPGQVVQAFDDRLLPVVDGAEDPLDLVPLVLGAGGGAHDERDAGEGEDAQLVECFRQRVDEGQDLAARHSIGAPAAGLEKAFGQIIGGAARGIWHESPQAIFRDFPTRDKSSPTCPKSDQESRV